MARRFPIVALLTSLACSAGPPNPVDLETSIFDAISNTERAGLCSASQIFIGRTGSHHAFQTPDGKIYSDVDMNVLLGIRGIDTGSQTTVTTIGGTVAGQTVTWDNGVKPRPGLVYVLAFGKVLKDYPSNFRKWHFVRYLAPEAVGLVPTSATGLRERLDELCDDTASGNP